MYKTTATHGENHGNLWRKPRQHNPHLIQLIGKPGNGRFVVTGSQSSVLGYGWTVHRIIKGIIIIKNRLLYKDSTDWAHISMEFKQCWSSNFCSKFATLGSNLGNSASAWLEICNLATLTKLWLLNVYGNTHPTTPGKDSSGRQESI